MILVSNLKRLHGILVHLSAAGVANVTFSENGFSILNLCKYLFFFSLCDVDKFCSTYKTLLVKAYHNSEAIKLRCG